MPTRAHYTALRRLDLGGGRHVMHGEVVPPEIRNLEVLLSAGHIQRVYLPYTDAPSVAEPIPPVAEDEPLLTAEPDEEE